MRKPEKHDQCSVGIQKEKKRHKIPVGPVCASSVTLNISPTAAVIQSREVGEDTDKAISFRPRETPPSCIQGEGG